MKCERAVTKGVFSLIFAIEDVICGKTAFLIFALVFGFMHGLASEPIIYKKQKFVDWGGFDYKMDLQEKF